MPTKIPSEAPKSPVDLAAELDALKRKNEKDCLMELQAVLEKYSCKLDVSVLLQVGRIDYQWKPVSK